MESVLDRFIIVSYVAAILNTSYDSYGPSLEPPGVGVITGKGVGEGVSGIVEAEGEADGADEGSGEASGSTGFISSS